MVDESERLLDRPGNAKAGKSEGKVSRELILIGGLLLALLGLGYGLFIMLSSSPELPPQPALSDLQQPALAADQSTETVEPAPQVAPPTPDLGDAELAPVAAPRDLDGSDAQVKLAAEDLSTTLLQWLTPEEQIRKWVLLVVNLANGDVVGKHRPLVYPMPPFSVLLESDVPYAAAKNYQRADVLVSSITALPADKLAAYYRRWQPLFEKAYGELGQEGNFHGQLLKAIDRILAVQMPQGSMALKRPNVHYVYADPALEQATELEKLLWRMGGENLGLVQEYLVGLKAAL